MGIKSSFSSLFFMVVFIVFLTSNVVGIRAQEGADLIASGATLKKVQSGFAFTEGPAADAEGNVYFSDIPSERIYKWACKDGSISVYREKSGRANGLMFDHKGRLVICEMGNNRVTLDDMNGQIIVLADSYNGRRLNSPNDLWIDPNGGIYFSDFLMQRGGKSGPEGGLQIYYISSDYKSLTRVTDDLVAPNGLIGSPDGKLLYIADPGDRKTWVYNIQADGNLSDKRLFCEQGSDGMAIDEKNNIYLTGDSSILIYNPRGDKIEEIVLSERPANMTFAGRERKTLFITAWTSVYTLEMAVRGALTPLDQVQGK